MIDWLIDTLLATSVLMAVVLLVREPVRRQFGPAVAYGLWLIPALRLMMPPLTRTVERSVAPVAAPLTPPSAMPAAETSLVAQFGGWETLAVSAWLAGASAMLIWGLLIYRRQRREVLRGSIELARTGNIRTVRSSAVRGPLAFGVFDRVIAVPTDFDARYDADERRLAFDHELAHHRAGDLAVNHLAFVLLCLQWFNPLAWASHAAFRFDQEAACDARVLDKASCQDHAAYAHAIAKAASGPALLFAGALDRPGTLHRRLRAMLTRPKTARRVTGKALVVLAAVAILPLTASRATQYVGAPPANAIAGRDAAADAEPGLPVIAGIAFGKNSVAFFEDDTVLINSKRKRLDQLTGAERARLRTVILESQRELAQERIELPRELAELRQEADRARSGEIAREIREEREELRRDLAEVDREADELREDGEDPETVKAEIRAALREVEATDIDREVREAIQSADPARIEAELRAEEQQMIRLLTRLDELGRR